MNYYIDFDNTLYNTKNLTTSMLNILANNISNKKNISFDEIYNECKAMFNKDNIYNIYKLVDFFAEKYCVNGTEIIESINQEILNGSKNVFRDVIPFLKRLKEKGNNIYMLTFCGSGMDYQLLKIKGSGISEFFDSLYITKKPKYELDIDYKNGIFIDDNPSDLSGLCSKNPICLIRIRRKENKYSLQDMDNIKEYTSFDEIDI